MMENRLADGLVIFLIVPKIDNMQKDLNTMELVTSKNWNDIAQLKAIK